MRKAISASGVGKLPCYRAAEKILQITLMLYSTAIKSQFGIHNGPLSREGRSSAVRYTRRRFSICKERDWALIKNEIAAARFQGGRLDRASYLICNSIFLASF